MSVFMQEVSGVVMNGMISLSLLQKLDDHDWIRRVCNIQSLAIFRVIARYCAACSVYQQVFREARINVSTIDQLFLFQGIFLLVNNLRVEWSRSLYRYRSFFRILISLWKQTFVNLVCFGTRFSSEFIVNRFLSYLLLDGNCFEDSELLKQ